MNKIGQKKVVFSAFFLLFFSSLASHAKGQQSVFVEAARVENTQYSYKATGKVQARYISTLAASNAAVLTGITVQEGDYLSKGQILATLDTRRITARLDTIEARIGQHVKSIEAHQVKHMDLSTDYEAIEVSSRRNAVSEQNLRNAKASLQTSSLVLSGLKYELAGLKAERESLLIQFEDASIKAPFDSYLIARHASQGEWIDIGQPIVTLVNRHNFDVLIEIPQRYAQEIRNFTDAKVTISSNDRLYHCENLRVIDMVEERTLTFSVMVTLPKDAGLMHGTTIDAWVPIGETADYLFVNKNSIVRNHKGVQVYKITDTKDDKGDVISIASAVAVKQLFVLNDYIAVDSGGKFKSGDLIAVEGNQRLLDGSQVKIVKNGKEVTFVSSRHY